jgi:hypothetical protein
MAPEDAAQMSFDSRQAVRYILGDLPPAAAAALEERYVSEEGFFELLEAAEAELSRDYVCGALSREDAERVERRCRSDARLRRQVELARALLEASRASENFAGRPALRVVPPRRKFDRSRWGALAVAAAVVAAIWLWQGTGPGRGQPPVANPGSATIPGESRPFLLWPGTTRGDSAGPQRVGIASQGASSRLGLVLPDPSPGPGVWTVELLRVEAEGPRRAGVSAARTEGSAWIVEVTLPPGFLQEGDYVARLSRRTPAGETQDFPSYSFSVEPH